jgi:hypothetical protein
MTTVFIRSAALPNIHLRMDRTGMTGFSGNGGGLINCQFYADPGTEPSPGSYEAFDLVIIPALLQPAGVAFAFRRGPVYLRMDGGSGTVNCQYYSQGEPEVTQGNDEVFQIVSIPGSSAFAIQSVNWQNTYLSMDGSTLGGWSGDGGGKVTSQLYAGGALPAADSLEAFYISSIIET